MSTRVLTVFMFFVTFVFSSCGPVSMEDAPTLIILTEDISALVVPTEEISDQPVPVHGYDQARDAIIEYLAGRYGLTLPAEWQSVDQMLTNLVGSSKTIFVGDSCTVTISAPVVAPEYLVYQIEVSDLASGLHWMGTVDAYGVITEESSTAPITVGSPEQARDLGVEFVAESQNLELPTEWIKQPNKIIDNSVVETYTGGPWVVQVSYIPSAPFVGEYQIVIDHLQAVIRWQGIADAHGSLDGSFVTGS